MPNATASVQFRLMQVRRRSHNRELSWFELDRRCITTSTLTLSFSSLPGLLLQNADGQIDIAYTLESQRLQHR